MSPSLAALLTAVISICGVVSFCVLPYDSVPQMWFIGLTIAGLTTIPVHVTLVRMFYPRMLSQPSEFVYRCSTITFLLGHFISCLTFLPNWSMYPLNSAVVCVWYLMFMGIGPFFGNLIAQARDRSANAPSSPTTPNDRTEEETKQQSNAEAHTHIPLVFTVYFGMGPIAVPVLTAYLCLFALTATPAEQTFCNVGLHTVILFQKELLLGVGAKRLSNPDARFLLCNYLCVITDCLSALVYSTMTLNAFAALAFLKFVSMFSYVALLSTRGIALKDFLMRVSPLRQRKKTFQERAQNFGVNMLLAMTTQVLACCWYLVIASLTLHLTWSRSSFPFSTVPAADMQRGMLYAGIDCALAIVSFE